MRYDFEITYVPGKDMTVVDTLSKQTLPDTLAEVLEKKLTAHIHCITKSLPAANIRLQVRESQAQDETCVQLTKYIQSDWLEKKQRSITYAKIIGRTVGKSVTKSHCW